MGSGTTGNQWPEGARCVALFTCDFDGTGNEIGKKLAPAGINAAGGYSARRGIPRMLEIFERHQIPATFFVPGYDAEQHPDTVRGIIAAGHEVAAHGYVHESFDVPEDEEERLLRQSHDILVDVTGTAPLGWRSPGGKKSGITLSVLRDLGYIFDSSDKDYDQPYPAVVAGEPSNAMVELPNNTSSLDDSPLYTTGAQSPAEVLLRWQQEFDAIYDGAGYFILTFHPRAGFGSGIPSRARVIDRMIAYIKTFPDVHFSRMGDLARWCLDPAHGFMNPPVRLGGR
jgi:peptidoglycan/xylan/chitin deacetylase (PgdA/CDA1 family)